jgi:cupin superfamily acireductone dioxygenase involved in methionine salvage
MLQVQWILKTKLKHY